MMSESTRSHTTSRLAIAPVSEVKAWWIGSPPSGNRGPYSSRRRGVNTRYGGALIACPVARSRCTFSSASITSGAVSTCSTVGLSMINVMPPSCLPHHPGIHREKPPSCRLAAPVPARRAGALPGHALPAGAALAGPRQPGRGMVRLGRRLAPDRRRDRRHGPGQRLAIVGQEGIGQVGRKADDGRDKNRLAAAIEHRRRQGPISLPVLTAPDRVPWRSHRGELL